MFNTSQKNQDNYYREGGVMLRLGEGFFREQSRPSRDLSVLIAMDQAKGCLGDRPLHWLDLMTGCGIRALRWKEEAASNCLVIPKIWANDADPNRLDLLEANLSFPMDNDTIGSIQLSIKTADELLAQACLEGNYFNLVDLDAFGNPGYLIHPVIQRVAFGGILFLASTDGRSPTGHDRRSAVRKLGTSARNHPASWEMALRQQIGLLARQAWMQGRGIIPLISFSEGRTFRIAIKLDRRVSADEELKLGFLARCEKCGAQYTQPLINLKTWPACLCVDAIGNWAISGPLWLGPLQQNYFIERMQALPGFISPACRRLLERLQADPGYPATVWSTSELSSRLGTGGPPPLNKLINCLKDAGHQAWPSGVMAGQVRTNADFSELLYLCAGLR